MIGVNAMSKRIWAPVWRPSKAVYTILIRLLALVLITKAIPATESTLTKEAYMSVKFHAFWIHQMCAFHHGEIRNAVAKTPLAQAFLRISPDTRFISESGNLPKEFRP